MTSAYLVLLFLAAGYNTTVPISGLEVTSLMDTARCHVMGKAAVEQAKAKGMRIEYLCVERLP